MRVKKFEAKSMKEALQMVKQELGPDAVILAARDNRKSFGLGGNASVEVTAAVSEGTLQKKQFTESRLPKATREQFATADARTQRAVIEKMIEKRQKREEEERRAAERAQTKRPITTTSYIDILDDEIEPSTRRSSALERASGRSVEDLLSDFEQEFDLARSAAARSGQTRAATAAVPTRAAQPTRAPRSEQPARLAKATEDTYGEEQNTQPGFADRAAARIRNAAREAWSNNPFMEDEAPKAPARRPAPPAPRSSTGLELVEDAFTELPLHAKAQPASQVSATPAPGVIAQGAKEIASLKGEIDRLHKMIEGFQKVPQTFTTMHPGADYGVGYDFSFMFQKLQEAGVSVDNAVEILKIAQKEIDPVQAKKRPIIDAFVARFFLNNIVVNPTPFTGRLHMFIGGSGSGKTTTLVKMAAQLVVKEKKKVAILSTDSSKVGAVDQMKIYCQILNVPFAVIRNKADWEWVMSQLRGVDHVLVDFPGMQLKDLEEIHTFKALLPPEGYAPITHLCVSATSKDGDADELARRYKMAEPNDLIFTNLDQSVQHGIIYNLHRRTGLPLHSFGIGGRIPEDFEPASKERVLDLIFRLTKLKKGES